MSRVHQLRSSISRAKQAHCMELSARFVKGSRTIYIDKSDWLDFATASYLGLDTDPEFVEFALRTISEFGIGRCSSPFYLSDESVGPLGVQISKIVGAEETVVFTSNSLANLAA